MISVTFYKNSGNAICGFCVSGHAEFAEYGQDIVCAAVSILTLNTVNSIESFTEELVDSDVKSDGFIKVWFPNIAKGNDSKDVSLLLRCLEKGLLDLQNEYQKYIRIIDEEV